MTGAPAIARTRRWVLVIPVLLLHGGAAWLLTHESLRGRTAVLPETQLRMAVRVLPAAAAPPAPAQTLPIASPIPTAPPAPKKRARTFDTDLPARAAVPDASQGITQPAPPLAPTDAPRDIAAPRGAALDLRLPRAASGAQLPSAQATNDPRSNSERKSVGDVLAGALGSDDRLIEEARGDGRLRVRKGASCVDVRPARGAELNPFEQSVRPIPRLVEACK